MDDINKNAYDQDEDEFALKKDDTELRDETDAGEPKSRTEPSHAAAMMESIHARHSVQPINLSLKNVTYAPVTKSYRFKRVNESRQVILKNVSVEIQPFKLSGWMGPSGAGKSSLLKLAAGLIKNVKKDLLPGSTILINESKGEVPKNLVSVVWQDDLLLSNLTVYETVEFSARLKTDSSVSDAEVAQLVRETIIELKLKDVMHSVIGGHGSGGISGGERKRVAVAVEMVARPSVLLLDEPTSGLDSTSAENLMKIMKNLATMGHSIVAVLHQPRTTIFEELDDLLLLSKGNVVYFGSTCHVRKYLENCPSVKALPDQTGIADWIMDTITHEETRAECGLVERWASLSEKDKESYLTSPCAMLVDNHVSLKRRLSSLVELRAVKKYKVGFSIQLKLLVARSMKQRRGEKLTKIALLVTLAYTVLTGIFWFRLPDDTSRIYDRVSLFFFILIAQSNRIVTEGVNVFQQEKFLLARERAKKLYGVLPYFIANTVTDMTNTVLLPCVFGAIVYWVANLRPTAAAFFIYLLSLYLTVSAAQSTGLFLSIAIPNLQISLMLAPLITLFLMILGGFYVPYQNMNPAIAWASWVSMARYGFSIFIINEFGGRSIPCSPGNSPLLSSVSSCPLDGDDVISNLGITGKMANIWVNIGILIALQVLLRVASYGLLRRSN
jgi:ABC-type multidrug transport system ATPase subunit